MERKNELLFRVYLVFFSFVLVAIAIFYKVVKTTLVEGEKWRSVGQKNIKWIDVEGERGNIYDVRGNLLATSLPYFDIKVDLLPAKTDKYFDENIDGLSQKLAEHFGKTAWQWKSELTKVRNAGKAGRDNRARYYSLLNKVSKEELELLKSFPLFNLGKYKGGLLYERNTLRERPFRELAKRTIGVNRNTADKVGLERTFDKVLSGALEKRLMRRLPGDVWLPVYDPTVMLQQKGSDLVTTLDMHIQDIAHDELEQVLLNTQAEKGVAIVMEVESGAIKAMVNLRATGVGTYEESFNDAVGSLGEPGSTFKLVSALALLDNGKVDLSTEVQMFGGIKRFYDQTMYDSERHGKQSGTFEEAFAISSNIGIGHTAFKEYGRSRDGWTEFYKDIQALGVMELTGVEIEGERTPKFKNPNHRKKNDPTNWSGTTVPWMSHGYELEMTPLQVLNVYNAVANGGRLMKPYLVKEVIDPSGEVRKIGPAILKSQMAKPSTIIKAKKLLEAVAERGTAKNLKIPGLTFAGKTGTTKLRYWEEGPSRYNASFAGYFPAERPKYSVMVIVYDPEGRDYYGSKVAGPVFKNIMNRITSYEQSMPVASEEDEQIEIALASSGHKSDFKHLLEFVGLKYKDLSEGKWINLNNVGEEVQIKTTKQKQGIPDVRGKGLRDAIFILEESGYQVEVRGYGKVYKQKLLQGQAPGIKVIEVYLK